MEKTTGKRPAELDGPDCPAEMEYLWYDFMMLSRGRTSNGFGANPLTWMDLLAWRQLTATPVNPWEMDTLVALDNAWLSEQAQQSKKTAKPKANPPPKTKRS